MFVLFIVRNKVKELIEFIQNDDRIQDERKKAKANRNRYVGMSSESLSYYHRKKFFFNL